MGGLTLSLAGWVDLLLLYWPLRFGDIEWEFAVITQTFDAMPLPTLGLVLLALAIQARGSSIAWSRGIAVCFAVVALLCLAALLLFGLDVPLALRMLRGAGAPASQQSALIAYGVKRAMAKVILFAVFYGLAYGWLAATMWRASREPISAGEGA